MNNFFISVSDIEEANIPLPNFNNRTESALSQIPVSESEVQDILNTLKVNKATGPDGVLKKGEKSDVSNYRPISLISCVGKSFERIVYKHIYNHITAHSLLYKYQSGFLPGHSTVHHLIELKHDTCLALTNYETICHVFRISKAFDRVWHKGLIHKLKKYRISRDFLD